MPLTVGGPTYRKQFVQLPDCVSGLVTVTVTAPAAWAGVVAVIVVAFTTVTPVAAVPPIVTVAPLTNPVPAIVTLVPPPIGPEFGVIELTVGGGTNVKQAEQVPDCVSGFVTTTFTVPATCAGVVAVIVVAFTTVTPVAAVPPMVTVAPPTKPVPLIVTLVPPAVGPLVGAIPLTVGGGPTNVKQPAQLPDCASGFVTVTVAAPAACAGVVAVIVVAFTTVTPVAAVPPMVTVAPATKFVPVIVTLVPPAIGPLEGAIPVTVGGGSTAA
jgi:hypothetical protein